MKGTFKVKKRRSFGCIPDDILEDIRIAPEARCVCGWMVSRPDGWEIRIAHVQRVLGLSDSSWGRIKKQCKRPLNTVLDGEATLRQPGEVPREV